MASGWEGRQLSIGWALGLCYFVGFRGKKLHTAVAVMMAESSRFVGAFHENIDPETGEVTSTDRGLFQINSHWHPDLSEEDAYKAIPNTQTAYEMSSGGKYWKPWMAFVNGAHVKFYPAIFVVRVLGRWKLKVVRIPKELGWGAE